METLQTVKESLRIVRDHRRLWLFGLFVAGMGGAGGTGGRSSGGGTSELPAWLPWALAAGALTALAVLVMHVVSEAALIEGVRRARVGLPFAIGDGFGVGRRHFLRLLGVKASLAAGAGIAAGLVALPLGAGWAMGAPLWLGALGAALCALLALPLLLALWLVVTWAARFVVLDGFGPLDALREGHALLASRLRASLELLVAWSLGAGLIGLFVLPAVLLAALLGLAGYAAGGVPAALVLFALVLVPAALLLAGAVGTYRSSLFTVAFLQARQAA